MMLGRKRCARNFLTPPSLVFLCRDTEPLSRLLFAVQFSNQFRDRPYFARAFFHPDLSPELSAVTEAEECR